MGKKKTQKQKSKKTTKYSKADLNVLAKRIVDKATEAKRGS